MGWGGRGGGGGGGDVRKSSKLPPSTRGEGIIENVK